MSTRVVALAISVVTWTFSLVAPVRASPISFGIGFTATAHACASPSSPTCDLQQATLPLTQGVSANIALPGPADDIISAQDSASGIGLSSEADAAVHGIIALGYWTGFAQADSSFSLSGAGSNASDPSAEAVSSAFWVDTFTATNNGAAFGTPVEYRFTMLENGLVSCTSADIGESTYNSSFDFGPVGGSGQSLTFNFNCNSTDNRFDTGQTMTVATTVGAVFNLEGSVALTALNDAFNGQSLSNLVDPPTSSFFVDPITPGASYMTASGVSYETPASTPVPEPMTLLLCGTGLVGYLVRRHRPS